MLKIQYLSTLILLFFSLTSYSSELLNALSKKAESGISEASYHLGMLYNNGVGVEKSPIKAFENFTKAAAHGDALGQYKVGCYHAGQFGEIEGISLDEKKAFEHKLIAAEAGYSLAQNDIAAFYYQQGMINETIEWAFNAGEQGYIQALSSLLSLYQQPESEFRSDKQAYKVVLKIKSLIPKNEALETLKAGLESKLKEDDVELLSEEVADWKPRATSLTKRAGLGIDRARLVAGLEVNG
jgi:TPR repeat protein